MAMRTSSLLSSAAPTALLLLWHTGDNSGRVIVRRAAVDSLGHNRGRRRSDEDEEESEQTGGLHLELKRSKERIVSLMDGRRAEDEEGVDGFCLSACGGTKEWKEERGPAGRRVGGSLRI